MNKLYIKAPIVLGAICVVSAGLLGGVNLLAKTFGPAPSGDAPETITVLNPGASFTSVEGFEPFPMMGSNTKITIEGIYEMSEGGSRTGYAYLINSGKAVKSDIKFSVAFQGEVSEATVNDLKPLAINVIAGGDSGYDVNIGKLADAIVAGSATMNDNSGLLSGGTKSQKWLLDGLQVARQDYVARWNGQAPGPVGDETLATIKGIFPDAVSYVLDEDFTPFTSKSYDVTDAKVTATTDKRYSVTLEDGSIARVYEGTGAAQVSPYDPTPLSIDLMVGYSGAVVEGKSKDIQPAGYKVISSDFSYSQWEDVYLAGVMGGTIDIDDKSAINVGATISADMIRNMMVAMRNDYYEVTLAAQKANVASNFETMFGENYKSFAADEGFTAIEAALVSETGSYKIDNRYTITLQDDSTVKVYHGSVACTFDIEGEEESMSAKLYVGFKGAEGQIAATLKESVGGFPNWVDTYLPGVTDGSISIVDENAALNTGSTYSSKAVRELLVGMRTDYLAALAA